MNIKRKPVILHNVIRAAAKCKSEEWYISAVELRNAVIKSGLYGTGPIIYQFANYDPKTDLADYTFYLPVNAPIQLAENGKYRFFPEWKFANVLSRKYRYHYLDMNEVLEDFLHDVGSLKATVRGPLFYSIHNVQHDEIVNAEFYMPMKEDWIEPPDDIRFHSYFSIENMVSLCIAENV